MALVGLAALPRLRFDFSPQTLFDSSSKRAEYAAAHRERYGADDQGIFVLVDGDLHEASGWRLIAELEAGIAALPGVEEHLSLYTLPIPRSEGPGSVSVRAFLDEPPRDDAAAAALAKEASGHPLLRRRFLSEDASAAALYLKVRDDLDKLAEVQPVIHALRALRDRAEADHPGYTVDLLGPPSYRVTVVEVMVRDEVRFGALSALLLALVLWILFRSVAGVVIPLASVGLGTIWTLALMAITGEQINIINTITATLILVIGVADAIHMMARYRQERADGLDIPAAIKRAVATVGGACFLTSLTTAVGFATLMSARLEILRHFGMYAALGVMITFGFTLLFVPWALLRFPGADQGPRMASSEDGQRGIGVDRLLAWCAHVVIARPRGVILVFVLLGALAVAGIPRAHVDNFIMEYVPRSHRLLAANQTLEAKMAGVVALDLVLELPKQAGEPWLDPELLRRAAQLEDGLRGIDGVRTVTSPLGLLRELRWVQRGGAASGEVRDALPASRAEAAGLLLLAEMSGEDTLIATHLNGDRTVLRISARVKDLGARDYQRLEAEVEALARRAFEGTAVSCTLTGTAQVGYAGIDSLIRDMLRSLGWAFVLIYLTLALLFRTPWLAAVAMIPNLLPLAALMGAMGWGGMHLETLSAMVFSIGLGIAVDDTIHFLARYREERLAGSGPEAAVRRCLLRTGRALVFTSVLLMAGFGILASSAFPPNQRFALLGGGVILVALVADLLLLPALLLVLKPHVPGAPPPISR